MMGSIGRVVRDEKGWLIMPDRCKLSAVRRSWEISAGNNPENLDRTIDLIPLRNSKICQHTGGTE